MTRPSNLPTRRAIAVLTGALCLTLAACGSSSSSTDSSSGSTEAASASGTVSFGWWGSDSRHARTLDAVAAFEAAYPGIHVAPEYSSFDGYFEKMNIAAAGGALPCVMAQDERFLVEYAERGLLADLSAMGLDTTDIPSNLVESATVGGRLVGAVNGVNATAIIADPVIFEAAGVELPDDTTWSWEDYVDTSVAIAEGSSGAYFGNQDYSFNYLPLQIFARQQGQEVFAEDGTIGVEPEVVAEWFQRSVELQDAGAEPSASQSVEVWAGDIAGSLVATNTGAMAWFFSNQLSAVEDASGRELVLLRPPGETQANRTGAFLKPSQYFSVTSTCENPEAAIDLVNFLVNTVEAGEILGADRGLPPNERVRAAVVPQLSDTDQRTAEYIDALSPTIVDGTPVPPMGSGAVDEVTPRVNSDLLFGKTTSESAGQRWVEEMRREVA